MFRAPDRRRAQAQCDFLAEPAQWGDDITFQLGEPIYWYRVERRPGVWAVVRYEAGEVPHEKFGSVPF
jgi:hypothetical protein